MLHPLGRAAARFGHRPHWQLIASSQHHVGEVRLGPFASVRNRTTVEVQRPDMPAYLANRLLTAFSSEILNMRGPWFCPNFRGLARCLTLMSGCAFALAPIGLSVSVAAEDAQAAIMKANAFIETAKMTERAVDSWERYASWVNMKTGPTGKERYILANITKLEAVLKDTGQTFAAVALERTKVTETNPTASEAAE